LELLKYLAKYYEFENKGVEKLMKEWQKLGSNAEKDCNVAVMAKYYNLDDLYKTPGMAYLKWKEIVHKLNENFKKSNQFFKDFMTALGSGGYADKLIEERKGKEKLNKKIN